MYPGAEVKAALRCAPGQAEIEAAGTVLFADRERSVFVPTSVPEHAARALAFFVTGVQRRIAGALQLGLWRWTGFGLTPSRLSLPARWQEQFDSDLGAAALYCGSPGPLQKLSLLLPARAGADALHLVKVALRPSADETVAREAQTLKTLADGSADVRRRVPHLIDEGVLTSGRRYLVTDAGSGHCGSARLRDEYLRFLQSVALATRTDAEWEHGDALGQTRSRLRSLGAHAITTDVRSLLEQALEASVAQLRGKRIPQTRMHGDFTRFNICQSAHDFIVFDWEYSRDGCNPIADVLHFGLSRRRVFRAHSALRSSLADADRFVALAFDDWRPHRRDLAALALHALVDTIVVYAAADGRLDTSSFIVRRHLGLLRSSPSWMST